MSFDSLYFFLFFVVVFPLVRWLPWSGMTLLLGSVAFYGVAGWRDFLVCAIAIAINWVFALRTNRSRASLAVIVLLNLLNLGFFKYRDFLLGGFVAQDVFGIDILIPLGISFYTFQLIAYQIDVHAGRARPQRSLARFALFSLFFPHLVAGPIMRERELMPQVDAAFDGRRRRVRYYGIGLGLCLLGLFKKVVLADSLSPTVDEIFGLGAADRGAAMLAVCLFTFQIYFDFSGYSDMAVGLAYLLGFRVPFNFRQPLLATSIVEFWQRWHITLTRWIGDFVYRPLASALLGAAALPLFVQEGLTLIVVWVAMGLWHGAAWTFVVFGVLQAAAMFLYNRWVRRRVRGYDAVRTLLGFTATFVFVVLTFGLIRAPSLEAYIDLLGTLLSGRPSGEAALPDDGVGGILIVAGCLSLLALHWVERRIFTRDATRRLISVDGPVLRAAIVGLCFWLVVLPKGALNPFVYFRF